LGRCCVCLLHRVSSVVRYLAFSGDVRIDRLMRCGMPLARANQLSLCGDCKALQVTSSVLGIKALYIGRTVEPLPCTCVDADLTLPSFSADRCWELIVIRSCVVLDSACDRLSSAGRYCSARKRTLVGSRVGI